MEIRWWPCFNCRWNLDFIIKLCQNADRIFDELAWDNCLSLWPEALNTGGTCDADKECLIILFCCHNWLYSTIMLAWSILTSAKFDGELRLSHDLSVLHRQLDYCGLYAQLLLMDALPTFTILLMDEKEKYTTVKLYTRKWFQDNFQLQDITLI